jgi:hypothetical protein
MKKQAIFQSWRAKILIFAGLIIALAIGGSLLLFWRFEEPALLFLWLNSQMASYQLINFLDERYLPLFIGLTTLSLIWLITTIALIRSHIWSLFSFLVLILIQLGFAVFLLWKVEVFFIDLSFYYSGYLAVMILLFSIDLSLLVKYFAVKNQPEQGIDDKLVIE